MDQEHFDSQYPEGTRSLEIDKIIAYTKEGSSCQLLGMPGVGRGVVLSLLANNKKVRTEHLGDTEANVHFVLANFSEIRKRPLFDAMKFLFLTLTESLRERKLLAENKAVGDIFREHLQFKDELILFQGFKEAVDYLALERKIRIVFLFDRFEEYIPTVTSEFFTNLRVLRQRAKYQFSVVFSLNRPLETILEPSLLADFYEYVAEHQVYMHLFDEEMTNFRVAAIEKITGKQLPKPTLSNILSLTGGHGKLTRLSVETWLAHTPQEKDLEKFLLSQKSVRGALTEIWRSFSPAEQSDILQGNFSDKDVAGYLEAIGLIKDSNIQIPLFAKFVAGEQDQQAVSSQKIVFDENTNTIHKGSIALSDQLTSSEFRLLRYLLQNQARIIDREELISIVWQGVKSTAGITDQAVDQLIFRLRRKIEEDANNPQHIQTVKGRGFKFVA